MVNRMVIDIAIHGYIIIGLVLIFFLFYYIAKFLNNKTIYNEKELLINKIDKFPSYLSILDHYMDNAYQIIYKDRIMVYSMEASRVPENELNTIVKDYISLTLKFMGSKLEDEFADLYGSYDTLYFVIGQNFFMKYEDDKIREASTNNMMEFGPSYDEEEG